MAKTTDKEAAVSASSSLKNFRTSSDVENFYRFISDNNLRAEAKRLVEVVLKQITPQKKRGRKKTVQ